jgi:hypothetical protein
MIIMCRYVISAPHFTCTAINSKGKNKILMYIMLPFRILETILQAEEKLFAEAHVTTSRVPVVW